MYHISDRYLVVPVHLCYDKVYRRSRGAVKGFCSEFRAFLLPSFLALRTQKKGAEEENGQ